MLHDKVDQSSNPEEEHGVRPGLCSDVFHYFGDDNNKNHNNDNNDDGNDDNNNYDDDNYNNNNPAFSRISCVNMGLWGWWW